MVFDVNPCQRPLTQSINMCIGPNNYAVGLWELNAHICIKGDQCYRHIDLRYYQIRYYRQRRGMRQEYLKMSWSFTWKFTQNRVASVPTTAYVLWVGVWVGVWVWRAATSIGRMCRVR